MPSDPGPNQQPNPNKSRRRPAPALGGNWIWLVVLVVLALFLMASPLASPRQIPWSDFYYLVKNDLLKEVVQVGDRYEAEIKDRNKLPDELKAKVPANGKFSVERLQGNDQPF